MKMLNPSSLDKVSAKILLWSPVHCTVYRTLYVYKLFTTEHERIFERVLHIHVSDFCFSEGAEANFVLPVFLSIIVKISHLFSIGNTSVST
jgi:hypothetical protein